MRGRFFFLLLAAVAMAALHTERFPLFAQTPPLAQVPRQAARQLPPSMPSALAGTVHIRSMQAGGAEGLPAVTGASPASQAEHCSPAASVEVSPSPEATDPVGLTVTKTPSGSNWLLNLAWSGSAGPFDLVYALSPLFQSGVTTLAKETTATSFSRLANAGAPLECYEVADTTVSGEAVQGMGYTPEPAPGVPAPGTNGLWWGDTITFTSSYLDPVAAGNFMQMYDRAARATSTDANPGDEYATTATFTVPNDARCFYPFISVHGRSSSNQGMTYVALYPKGIGPYTNIHGIAYAPQTGRTWIAADGTIQDVDVFRQTPAVLHSITGLTKPYITKVTTGGMILYVDGVLGVTTVWQADVNSGTVTAYASTTDDTFTRQIQPVGIAAEPDGSACYIADASLGKVVKIPAGAGPGHTTIKDNWGNYTWGFPDPCGMDTDAWHHVYVASTGGWIGQISGQYTTYLNQYTSGLAYGIEVDRDLTTASGSYLYYTNDLGLAEAYNQNVIEGVTGNPIRYHGAILFGMADGHLAVDPQDFYFVYHHWPQRVVVNNSGQNEAYPSSFQQADQIIRLDIGGWYGMYQQVRVIDPPDLSPYAPDGGWCGTTGYPACTAALPYEGNDNYGTDYGLSNSVNGPWTTTVTLRPGADNIPADSTNNLALYFKVPARYSGNNFQVEVTKCNASGTPIPTKVLGLSAVYTAWKRVYVERDSMFRRGGVIYAPDATHMVIPAGVSSVQIYKGPSGAQLDNLVPGDKIAIFDASATHPFEGTHDEAFVGSIDRTSSPDYAIVSLVTQRIGGTTYTTQFAYTASPIITATHYPDFSKGSSAGIGVVNSNDGFIYDVSPNRLPNGPGSAFYDADMRDIERPYDDASVEFIGLRDGMGAVPYVHWITSPSANSLIAFQQLWFKNQGKTNYLHLLGIEDGNPDVATSIGGSPFNGSNTQSGASLVYVQKIITLETDPAKQPAVIQYCTVHELTHNFSIQGLSKDTYHCANMAWPVATDTPGPHECIMNENLSASPPKGFVTYLGSAPRFCVNHLLTGDSTLVEVTTSIRNQQDPLPY